MNPSPRRGHNLTAVPGHMHPDRPSGLQIQHRGGVPLAFAEIRQFRGCGCGRGRRKRSPGVPGAARGCFRRREARHGPPRRGGLGALVVAALAENAGNERGCSPFFVLFWACPGEPCVFFVLFRASRAEARSLVSAPLRSLALRGCAKGRVFIFFSCILHADCGSCSRCVHYLLSTRSHTMR